MWTAKLTTYKTFLDFEGLEDELFDGVLDKDGRSVLTRSSSEPGLLGRPAETSFVTKQINAHILGIGTGYNSTGTDDSAKKAYKSEGDQSFNDAEAGVEFGGCPRPVTVRPLRRPNPSSGMPPSAEPCNAEGKERAETSTDAGSQGSTTDEEKKQNSAEQEERPQQLHRKSRPCKGKRMRLRNLTSRLIEHCLENPDDDLKDFPLPPSVEGNPILQEKILNSVRDHVVTINSPASTDATLDEADSTDTKPDDPGHMANADTKPDEPGNIDAEPERPGSADTKPEEPDAADGKLDEPGSTFSEPNAAGNPDATPDEPDFEEPDDADAKSKKPGEPDDVDVKPEEQANTDN